MKPLCQSVKVIKQFEYSEQKGLENNVKDGLSHRSVVRHW